MEPTPIQSVCIAHVHCTIILIKVGVKVHINQSIVIPEKAAPITGIISRTTGPEPADSRQ